MLPYYEGTTKTYTDEELEELKNDNKSSIINTDKLEIDDISSKAKKELQKSCNNILKHGLNNGTEALICINKNTGEYLSDMIIGNNKSVYFTEELVADLLLEPKNSIIMIHNHPSSSSFSSEDMVNLFKFESISDLVVVGHDKTMYTLSLGKGARLDIKLFKEDYLRAKNEVMQKYIDKVTNKEMTKQKAWYEHSNELLTTLSDFYKWKYRRYKNEM